MKKTIIALAVQMIIFAAAAQTNPVKIVFDITSKDTLAHQGALRHMTMMAKAYPQSTFELVVYGAALPMFVKGQSTIEKALTPLVQNKNVTFKVCSATMKRYNIDKTQLITGVEVVPDAIMEIVTKQGEGWGYIKEGN
ncbi:MAG TPA: DsrE family protein [Chryseolinea sp.]|nr:DsrE family protein [Chryseolinea sp.]